MSVESNKEVVRKYVDAILVNRDFSKFSEYTAPGFYIDRSAVPEAIAGEEGLHTQMDMLYGAFPDLDLSIVNMVAEGDYVVVRFAAPGTQTGEFAGIPAIGQKGDLEGPGHVPRPGRQDHRSLGQLGRLGLDRAVEVVDSGFTSDRISLGAG